MLIQYLELKRVDAVPERLLRRHVHEEEGGDGRHGLAVAVDRVQDGVGLEHAVQLGLPDALVHAAEQLVRRKVPVQVLLDGVDPLLVAALVLFELKYVNVNGHNTNTLT